MSCLFSSILFFVFLCDLLLVSLFSSHSFCSFSPSFVFGSISLLILSCYHFLSSSLSLPYHSTGRLQILIFTFNSVAIILTMRQMPSKMYVSYLLYYCVLWLSVRFVCVCLALPQFRPLHFFSSLFWSHQIYLKFVVCATLWRCYYTVRVSPCGGICFRVYQTDTIVTSSFTILPFT